MCQHGESHILVLEPPAVVEGVLTFPEGTDPEVAAQGHPATSPQLGAFLLSARVTGWGHRMAILVISALLPVGDSFWRRSWYL